ncbi:MAG TPA: PKD domain-containing protein [Gemmatimonadales bacterium]|nr:PKD domain-containing protein [Gemmatimonadales bacterium]
MRRAFTSGLILAALAVACTDNMGPGGPDDSRNVKNAATTASGIALDKEIGTLNEQNQDTLAKGFNPANPHLGDAIVATFFWTGPATIVSVSDFETNAAHTPIGNTFHLVEQVSAGGISMATYVATNIQGYPDPNPDPTIVYAVRAIMSQPVPDGGVDLSTYSGVAPVFTDALGGHSSGSGASSANTVSDPGAVPITAGALAYAVTSANAVVGRNVPAGYTRLPNGVLSDNSMVGEDDYMVDSVSGSTDPTWSWGGFSNPATWLASVLVLNPGNPTTNQPPVAAFTPSCSGLTCNFTSTSSDPDGTISSYAWTFGDGGTSAAQNPSHTYAAAGTYTVTLTVTDNGGATNATSQNVTVSAANQSPTAAFTSSCSSLTCAFTNSSSDPDGTIASNSWTFGDGATSTAQSPSHTYAAAGTYTVTLTVTDNQGATNSVSHPVTVAAANQPPTAAFTSSCSALTCAFTNASSDPDGTIASNSWNFGDGQTSTAASPSHTYAAGGTYSVTLTVTDNQGATNSVSHSVTVTAPNQPPIAAFTSSCSGLSCNFTSTASDPDGSISAYHWSFGDGATSTAQNPSHSYAAGGTYAVTLTVTDNQGATNSVSHSVTVTQPNRAPVVNAGPDQTVLLGVLYTLNASFSDPDNGPWTYTINWGDGATSSGVKSSNGTISAGHTYLGILTRRTITVTVTDSKGASGSDTKVITLIL